MDWNYEDIPDGSSEEDWDEWCDRFQEALIDVPRRHLELQKEKAIELLEMEKKSWTVDMKKLQRLNSGLQDDVAYWYQCRPAVYKIQKELDQAKENLKVFDEALVEKRKAMDAASASERTQEARLGN
jgi:hypothetical protein